MRNTLALLLSILTATAYAVVIEGTTPSGKFKTVGLDESGKFQVSVSSGVAQHVVVDSGTVTSYQGGQWNVTTTAGTSVTVSASTSSLAVSGQFVAPLASCYPADAARRQGLICNSDAGADIYIGPPGVGTGTGAILSAGSCLSPDVPSSFVGQLDCTSTAPAHGFFLYFK